MKKKNLNHKELKLNKKIISGFESEKVLGGGTNSCFQYANTDCANTVGCNQTNTCQTNGCPPQTNGCPPQTDGCPFISQSCPDNGIC